MQLAMGTHIPDQINVTQQSRELLLTVGTRQHRA